MFLLSGNKHSPNLPSFSSRIKHITKFPLWESTSLKTYEDTYPLSLTLLSTRRGTARGHQDGLRNGLHGRRKRWQLLLPFLPILLRWVVGSGSSWCPWDRRRGSSSWYGSYAILLLSWLTLWCLLVTHVSRWQLQQVIYQYIIHAKWILWVQSPDCRAMQIPKWKLLQHLLIHRSTH
jgi:hypothetical protein